MKRQLVAVLVVLGAGYAARAQEAAVTNATPDDRNVAAAFSAAPTTNEAQFQPLETGTLSLAPSIVPDPSFASPAPAAAPKAPPSPAPEPKFLYGERDDTRWQLAIGADWLRFRSSIFNASAVGIDSSVTYFTNDWFGIEGDVATAFAPDIYDREHVKLLVYGAGAKISWRINSRWEPWLHTIVGGAHEQPQTANNSKNAFAVQAGGGADYRFNPRFSGRLEADWVHTGFFGQSQNNFKLMGGVVFHF
ncbi:MAG: hypothetical protein WA639_13605 [Candidatus Acidiferrum sp.]